MRYYAGNWATTWWLFRKGSGAEEKLDTDIVKAAPLVVDQVADLYDRELAEYLLNKGLSFRSMHSHGRALNALLPHAVEDVEAYDVREGELISNVVNGWNFGDGHFHGLQLLEAIQERCGFAEGDVRVVTLESEPMAGSPTRGKQRYAIYDAAGGLLQGGFVRVDDMVRRQPWLDESFDFPVEVTTAPAGRSRSQSGGPDPGALSEAIIVGAGPNGLACAVALAQEGIAVTVLEAEDEIGGGTRSGELTVPGLVHDVCSAVHPMAVGSPFLNSLELERHGLEWRWPEVDCAHPLDDGSAGVMLRSIEETARGLGDDGAAWRRVFERPARSLDVLVEDIFRPFLHVPRHPLRLVNFGLRAAAPAMALGRAWRSPQARALFGGVAAHAIGPLGRPMSSSVGMALISACHRYGWAVARGGSQAIADALAAACASAAER